jgi:hypothetical protein
MNGTISFLRFLELESEIGAFLFRGRIGEVSTIRSSADSSLVEALMTASSFHEYPDRVFMLYAVKRHSTTTSVP